MSEPDDLRAAFHHGATGATGAGGPLPTGGAAADALLDRVHRRARRRRVRRNAGMAAVAVVGLGSVAVVAAAVLPVTAPDDAAPDGTDPAAGGGSWTSELAVYDVQTAGDAVWALAAGDCGRGQLCAVVASSTDDGTSWQLDRPQQASGRPALSELRSVDVSADGSYLLGAGRGAAVSRDAGQSWRPVEVARGRQVLGAAVGATSAVVVFDEPGSQAMVTARTDGDGWTIAEPPVGAGERLTGPFGGGDLVGATVLSGPAGDVAGLVVRSGAADWVRVRPPCPSRAPLVATDGATVWYVCHGDGPTALFASDDLAAAAGRSRWSRTDLPAARYAGMGAWGDGAVVVATGRRVFRVDADGSTEELTGPGDGLTLDADDYTYRSTANGWLASFRGVLFHRSDDGSWGRVPVP